MKNLTPRELFTRAKEAFLAGDIKTVRELGKEASRRLDEKGLVYVEGIGRIHVDDLNWGLENGALVETKAGIGLLRKYKKVIDDKPKKGRITFTEKEVVDISKINEFFGKLRTREMKENAISQTMSFYEDMGL